MFFFFKGGLLDVHFPNSSPTMGLTQSISTWRWWWMMESSLLWNCAARTGTLWQPHLSVSCTKTLVSLKNTCVWICLSVHVHGLYLTVYFLWMLGGSETFQDKVSFFQRELRHIHSKRPRIKTCLKISRHSILDSVSSSTCWSLSVPLWIFWILPWSISFEFL